MTAAVLNSVRTIPVERESERMDDSRKKGSREGLDMCEHRLPLVEMGKCTWGPLTFIFIQVSSSKLELSCISKIQDKHITC